MATKVLVFESDASFAAELRDELRKHGAVTRVVDDGVAGLQVAQSERPDVIVLSVELPGVNGFGVCTKIKRDGVLKDIPLLIMSSTSSAATFDEHRNLKGRRADAYIHKPIAAADLAREITALAPLDDGSLTNDESVIDDLADAVLLDEGEGESDGTRIMERSSMMPPEDETPPASARPVSARPSTRASEELAPDVEAFADGAFDVLLSNSSRPPPQGGTAESSRPPAYQEGEYEGMSDLDRARAELARRVEFAQRLETELAALREEVSGLREASDREASARDEAQRLRRELDEVRARTAAAPRSGGASSREFFDLREALNKKDQEILALRDEHSRKDRELLDLRSGALSFERQKADVEDRLAETERGLDEARTELATMRADREREARRSAELSERGDNLKAELEQVQTAAMQAARDHEEARVARDAAEALLREKHAAEVADAEANHRTEIEALEARAREQRDAAVADAEARGRSALTRALADAAAEQTRAIETTRREGAELLARANADAERLRSEAIAEAKREATEASEAAIARALSEATEAERLHVASLTSDYEIRLSAARDGHAAAIASLNAEHALALAKAVHDGEQRLEQREAELFEQQQDAMQKRQLEHEQAMTQARQTYASEQQALLADAERAKRELDVSRDAAAAAERTIAQRIEERDLLSRELASERNDSAKLRDELSQARDELSLATRRLDFAEKKWSDDRASLGRARDGLRVALASIEEAIERPLL